MELTEENKGDDNVNIGTLIKTFIILILVQIIYGAFMAGLKAGYLLQPNSNLFEKLFSYSFRDSNDFSLLNNGYDIQAFHRLLAWVIAIFAFFIYKKTKKTQLMNEGRLLLYVVFIQITLGICTLLLGVNIYIAVIHQFFAIILMISALRVLYFSSGNSQ
jgi:cytochrome c oxidase assembly protein subunit 15